jgi:hypothetical protein
VTTTNQASPLSTETKIKLALAWTFVGIPLLIGVGFTIYNSLPLFR